MTVFDVHALAPVQPAPVHDAWLTSFPALSVLSAVTEYVSATGTFTGRPEEIVHVTVVPLTCTEHVTPPGSDPDAGHAGVPDSVVPDGTGAVTTIDELVTDGPMFSAVTV